MKRHIGKMLLFAATLITIIFIVYLNHESLAEESCFEFLEIEYSQPITYETKTIYGLSSIDGYLQGSSDYPIYEGAAVPDAQTAINICNAIFEGMLRNNDYMARHYGSWTVTFVIYDIDEEIWIVMFEDPCQSSENMTFDGPGLSIAIHKQNGALIQITHTYT